MDEAIQNANLSASQATAPTAAELVSVPREPGPRERAPLDRPASGGSTGRWLWLLALLVIIATAPYLVGPFVYQMRFNRLKADYDVASGALSELKPRLSDFELASRLVAKRLEPSVVSIFRPGRMGREGQGSGVIVDSAGYVITNYHVVRDATTIEVQLSDGRRTDASDVWYDEMTDLAVLRIDLPNLVAAEWGDSDELEVGDLVWALGSPFGLDRSITFGIVSAKARRSGTRLTSSPYQEYLQTDAAVNPGNSGGPLVNIEGQVVGINAAIFGPTYQGISFAIPSNVAKEQYDQLRINGRVERAWLGISPWEVPQATRRQLGLAIGEGVFVRDVPSNTPADRAGIRPGDVILQWNDFVATDPTLLSRAIAATKIGSTATVRLVRSNGEGSATPQELELAVEVERRPIVTN